MKCGIVFCVGILLLAASSNMARAELVLQPPGLAPGDLYRLAFVTSGDRDATSSDIADYNAFVQAAADAGPLAALGQTWKAIASTISVAARDNTGTGGQVGVNDHPIYLVDGSLVAVSNGDLWDGTILNPIITNENGVEPIQGTLVWTGSHANGTASIPLGFLNPKVGLSGQNVTSGLWAEFLQSERATSYPLYALSGPIRAVPEPASYVLAIVSGLAGLAFWWRRRRG